MRHRWNVFISGSRRGRASTHTMSIGVFHSILNGIHDKKTDRGALYVCGAMCEYRTLDEWRVLHEDFGDELQALLDGKYAKEAFFVVEKREGTLHVMAYPRSRVMREVAVQASQKTATVGQGDGEAST